MARALPLPPRPMDLARALDYSHYARRLVSAHPALRDELEATLDAPFDAGAALAALAPLAGGDDAAALHAALRRLRQRAMLHTLSRDLTGRAPLAEVFATMTTLADGAIGLARDFHHRDLARAFGEPRAADGGAAQSLHVIALGKHGGGELNVSSDIDLVFAYPDEGETDGARAIANREFFDRLGRRVIGALDEVTADGFVFRVDMRLRPYGDSGALTALVAPFVYRKYLDFDAYEGLRDVHRQIREQARRASHGDDIKLGPGGIREIEFTVQAQQLVRGGREPALRIAGTVDALAAIESLALLPAGAVDALGDAYAFLRHVEHRLQYRDDRQTQRLPTDAVEVDALAAACGFASAAAWREALDAHRRSVDTWFSSLFGDASAADEASPFAGVWDAPHAETHRALLAEAGFDDPDALVATLAAMRGAHRYTSLPVQSRRRFDKLMPALIAAAAAEPGAAGAQATLARLVALLEAIARRSAYLALLIEHPPLLPRIA